MTSRSFIYNFWYFEHNCLLLSFFKRLFEKQNSALLCVVEGFILSRSHQLFRANLTYIWKCDELNYIGIFIVSKMHPDRANSVEIWAFSLSYFLTGNIDRLPRVNIYFFRLFSLDENIILSKNKRHEIIVI